MRIAVDVLAFLLVAFVGLVALFVLSLYIRGAFRSRSLMHIKGAIAPDKDSFPLMMTTLSESLSTSGKVVDFWHKIEDIQQARIDAMLSARHSICFETFMMTPGQRAQDFAAAAAQKASEGVAVQVLVDMLGARSIPDKYWRRLRSSGVQVIFFNPWDWRAPANFAGRTHRKLLIVDNERALIGGAGISDLWDGTEKADDTRPWFDIEIALTGEVVAVLSMLFQKHWQGHQLSGSKVAVLDLTTIFREGAVAVRDAVSSQEKSRREESYEKNSEPKRNRSKVSVVLVTPSAKPSYRDSAIEMQKQLSIASARERVWLSSPYFLPNESTRDLLIKAHEAGVDVRILTTSARSDKKPVYYASYEVYGNLLRAGIAIYEYQPSMLHAKMLLIDREWVATGSANFDYRSFLHNDELDIVTDSQLLISKVEQVFEEGFSDSREIGLKQWKKRSLLKHRILGNAVRLVQWQL